MTFTKIATIFLLIVGVINSEIPFLLSYMDKDPVYIIGQTWIVEVIGVFAIYAIKSFFGKRQEKIQELEDYKAGLLNKIDAPAEKGSDPKDGSDAVG